MKLIILGTGNVTLKVINICLQDKEIELLGVILDDSVDAHAKDEFTRLLVELGVNILEFTKENFGKADIIFTPEYRKIIPEEYANKYIIVNCHGGILPYYRGYAANAWAIMNGANEIGYTFHRVNAKLDDGEIYHVGRIKIDEKQTYADVHGVMVSDIVTNAPGMLKEIADGKRRGKRQEGKKIYCNKFSPQMGYITDFSVNASYIYRLYRCMAKPLGTGIFFTYKDKKYDVNKVDLGVNRDVDDYIGIPGKVVNIENNELWIKTKDNVIIFSDITDETGQKIVVSKCFKNGNKIG